MNYRNSFTGGHVFAMLLVLACHPVFARLQGPIAPPPSSAEFSRTYPVSADGLRMQLQELLDVAQQSNASGLESLIRKMEIPDAGNWFAKAYGNERAMGYTAGYNVDLPRNESNFDALLQQLGKEDGNFSVRKVNDAPAAGMEERMLDGLQAGSEIFFAGWKKTGSSPNFSGRPVGYFVFADGRFRLIRAFDNMPERVAMSTGAAPPRTNGSAAPIGAADRGRADDQANGPMNGPVQPRVRIASWPMCDYCPAAEYSASARKNRLEGNVVLQVMVQPDGSATDIQVVKSPDPELSQMAVAAVSRWRFKPARDANGEAVPYREPIDMNFRLPK